MKLYQSNYYYYFLFFLNNLCKSLNITKQNKREKKKAIRKLKYTSAGIQTRPLAFGRRTCAFKTQKDPFPYTRDRFVQSNNETARNRKLEANQRAN